MKNDGHGKFSFIKLLNVQATYKFSLAMQFCQKSEPDNLDQQCNRYLPTSNHNPPKQNCT